MKAAKDHLLIFEGVSAGQHVAAGAAWVLPSLQAITMFGLISIPISTIMFGLIFLLFGKAVSRYLWAIIKALQM
jgi:hypothetical protein